MWKTYLLMYLQVKLLSWIAKSVSWKEYQKNIFKKYSHRAVFLEAFLVDILTDLLVGEILKHYLFADVTGKVVYVTNMLLQTKILFWINRTLFIRTTYLQLNWRNKKMVFLKKETKRINRSLIETTAYQKPAINQHLLFISEYLEAVAPWCSVKQMFI